MTTAPAAGWHDEVMGPRGRTSSASSLSRQRRASTILSSASIEYHQPPVRHAKGAATPLATRRLRIARPKCPSIRPTSLGARAHPHPYKPPDRHDAVRLARIGHRTHVQIVAPSHSLPPACGAAPAEERRERPSGSAPSSLTSSGAFRFRRSRSSAARSARRRASASAALAAASSAS